MPMITEHDEELLDDKAGRNSGQHQQQTDISLQ